MNDFCEYCGGDAGLCNCKDIIQKQKDNKHDEILRLGCIKAAATRLQSDYSDDTFELEVKWYYNYVKTGEWE